jgi:hypothetical protein
VSASNFVTLLANSTLGPNMALASALNTQSSSFTFTACLNVNMAVFSSLVLWVTNSSGSPIQATAAAGWHTNGNFMVTNVTSFTINIVPGWFTNVISSPRY